MKVKIEKRHTAAFGIVRIAFLAVAIVCSGVAQAAEEKNTTVLITGANRGLGLEYAKQFVAAGNTVIGTARNPDEATELKEIGAEVIKLDVTSEEDIANMAKSLKGRTIDVLINNAGYFSQKTTREEMNLSFSINTLGPLYVSEALIPNLSLSESPRIVNISSQAAVLTESKSRGGAYSVSKTALNMVTRNLHLRFEKKGFIVISLDPGHNQTEMGGKGAPLKPDETAAMIVPFIESLTVKHAGGFWNYAGNELAW